jgi:hypothetical protein
LPEFKIGMAAMLQVPLALLATKGAEIQPKALDQSLGLNPPPFGRSALSRGAAQ